MQAKVIEKILQTESTLKAPRVGDIIKVHQKVQERGKERIQIFQGIVIAVKKQNSPECTFTVRRDQKNGGVERIFPLGSPLLAKIEKVSKMHNRQSKMYYLRDTNVKLKESKKTFPSKKK